MKRKGVTTIPFDSSVPLEILKEREVRQKKESKESKESLINTIQEGWIRDLHIEIQSGMRSRNPTPQAVNSRISRILNWCEEKRQQRITEFVNFDQILFIDELIEGVLYYNRDDLRREHVEYLSDLFAEIYRTYGFYTQRNLMLKRLVEEFKVPQVLFIAFIARSDMWNEICELFYQDKNEFRRIFSHYKESYLFVPGCNNFVGALVHHCKKQSRPKMLEGPSFYLTSPSPPGKTFRKSIVFIDELKNQLAYEFSRLPGKKTDHGALMEILTSEMSKLGELFKYEAKRRNGLEQTWKKLRTEIQQYARDSIEIIELCDLLNQEIKDAAINLLRLRNISLESTYSDASVDTDSSDPKDNNPSNILPFLPSNIFVCKSLLSYIFELKELKQNIELYKKKSKLYNDNLHRMIEKLGSVQNLNIKLQEFIRSDHALTIYKALEKL